VEAGHSYDQVVPNDGASARSARCHVAEMRDIVDRHGLVATGIRLARVRAAWKQRDAQRSSWGGVIAVGFGACGGKVTSQAHVLGGSSGGATEPTTAETQSDAAQSASYASTVTNDVIAAPRDTSTEPEPALPDGDEGATPESGVHARPRINRRLHVVVSLVQ
jgi:hypothetical protein